MKMFEIKTISSSVPGLAIARICYILQMFSNHIMKNKIVKIHGVKSWFFCQISTSFEKEEFESLMTMGRAVVGYVVISLFLGSAGKKSTAPVSEMEIQKMST